MGRERAGARDRAAGRQQRRADVCLHEPRSAGPHDRVGRSGLLEPFAPAPVAQGRGKRARPEGARVAPRLRQRRGAAQSRATRRRDGPGRDRLPHRAAFVFLPAVQGRRVANRRTGLERSAKDPQMTTGNDTLARLAAVIESRKPADAPKSYIARLLLKGNDAVLKKIGEEATEVVMAFKDGERDKIVAEVADLWFHSMIALAQFG